MKKNLCVFSVFILLISPLAFADDYVSPTSNTFEVAAWYGYSPSTGSTQIPLGGVPGTSSITRPTQDELGIDALSTYNLMLAAHLPNFGVYGMYKYARQSGNHVLTQNLITHGVQFPAGTMVIGGTKFDTYRLGINFPMQFSQGSIYPIVEFTVLDFGYNISSNITTTSRAFKAGTVRFGAGAQYNFSPQLSLDVDFETSIGSFTYLNMQTGSAHLAYNFYQAERFSSIIFAGVGYTNIYFKDNQSFPNLIQIRQFPEVQVGLKIATV